MEGFWYRFGQFLGILIVAAGSLLVLAWMFFFPVIGILWCLGWLN